MKPVNNSFNGLSADPVDALTNLAGLLNAGLLLVNSDKYSDIAFDVLSVAYDYAQAVAEMQLGEDAS